MMDFVSGRQIALVHIKKITDPGHGKKNIHLRDSSKQCQCAIP